MYKVESCEMDEDTVWATEDGWRHMVKDSDGTIMCVCDDEAVAKNIAAALSKT